MKVLIFGGGGLLGHKLAQVFKSRFEVSATFHRSAGEYRNLEIFDGISILENVDAEDLGSVVSAVSTVRPDVILNAIGITKHVPNGSDVIKTLTVNSLFPHQLAEAAGANGARLISISTDCVFSGKDGSYTETDNADATDLYGKSKNLGEVVEGECLTLRTSIIGRELFTTNSLVEWLVSNRGGRVKGFTRAIFTGFPTVVLAELLISTIADHPKLSGLYHVSSDAINKFELLRLIDKEMGLDVEIEPSDEVAIDRSLDSTKFRTVTGFRPRPWPEMIELMAADAQNYEAIRH